MLMKFVRILSIALCSVTLVAVQACKKEVEVKTDAQGDTTKTTTVAPDTTASSAGQEIKDESIEKKVEMALVAEPGFSDVHVESAPDGVIILTGTAAGENEKARAQVIAENVGGVKKVTNNITIKK
jgi:osmotically-inducible protein OsmY